MNKLKALICILAALMTASAGAPPCRAETLGTQTKIIRLWYRIKGNKTCLTFDAQGPRPKRIDSPSETGISVFFSSMSAKLVDRSFTGAKIAIKAVKFRHGDNFLEVLFRWQNTSVTYSLRPGWHDRYSLTLIFTPPAVKKPVTANTAGAKPTDFIQNGVGAIASPVDIKRIHTSELFGTPVSPQAKQNFETASKSELRGQPAQPQNKNSLASQFVEPDKKGLALYALADKKFQACANDLVFCAPKIISAYKAALEAGPRSSLAPLAIYRSGLAYYNMGKYDRAEQFFKTVTSQWPQSPVASLCWLNLGNISVKRQAFIEAMEEYKWAQRDATGKEDLAAADFMLGKTYYLLGAYKEALQTLNDCLVQLPGYYLKNPGVLRYIGEADFSLGDFADAKQVLLRYVNYQESDPDQAMVLAKIGEIFLKEGQVDAAKMIYSFVHKYYTNSEGDVICRLRSAELMEKVNVAKATHMYDDLRSMDLSPNLRSIVLLKLAELELKNSNLEQGMEMMNKAFPVKSGSAPPPEIAQVRKRFFCDLIRQFYYGRHYDRAIKLIGQYRAVFNSINSPETLEEIAECYAAQKSYFSALEVYDRLFSQEQGKNVDGLLLRCAVYALRLRDYGRASNYAQAAKSGVLDLKKTEILGHVFYHNEQYSDAVNCFEKVIQQRNTFYITDPNSYAALGYSLYKVKKYGEAVPILQKALLAATTDKDQRVPLLVTISDCQKEQQQYETAAQTLETALSIAGPEEQNQLRYKSAKLYLTAGKMDLALKKLNEMKSSKDSFWSAVAQEELNTLNMAAQNNAPQK
jgi:tetratricopeptide (TPR) repeat protein